MGTAYVTTTVLSVRVPRCQILQMSA